MPADPSLQPNPTDMELATLRKINQIASALVAPDPDLASGPRDIEFMSLRKINQLLWNLLDAGGSGAGPTVGPWTPVPVDPSYAGTGGSSTIQARWVGDPVNGYVQLKGNISGGQTWASAQTLIATLPAGLVPTVAAALLVPSGLSNPDSCSILMVASNGAIYLQPCDSFTYSTSPNQAYFAGVNFPLS
jgi:hypothetical protein